MATAEGLAFFRVTVLGAGNTGKTCLINAFVNNFCPTVYTVTDDPTLYYRTVRMPSEEDEGKVFSVLVEVEDTYSSNAGDPPDIYGQKRDVMQFIDMSRSRPDKAKPKDEDPREKIGGVKEINMPYSVYEPPTCYKYEPLTKGRMGFLIVFDVNDMQSYKEAMQIHLYLQEDLNKKKIHLKPVVFLCGNKIDKEPGNPAVNQVIGAAQEYSQKNQVKFFAVSALEFKNVKKMFRNMLADIRTNQLLWIMDEGGDEALADMANGKGGCAVQ